MIASNSPTRSGTWTAGSYADTTGYYADGCSNYSGTWTAGNSKAGQKANWLIWAALLQKKARKDLDPVAIEAGRKLQRKAFNRASSRQYKARNAWSLPGRLFCRKVFPHRDRMTRQ